MAATVGGMSRRARVVNVFHGGVVFGLIWTGSPTGMAQLDSALDWGSTGPRFKGIAFPYADYSLRHA